MNCAYNTGIQCRYCGFNSRCEIYKENTELKAFINAPLIKGRRTTRKEFYQTIWDLSGQLTKAKEIIRKLVLEVKGYEEINGYDTCEPVQEAEYFLNSEVENV